MSTIGLRLRRAAILAAALTIIGAQAVAAIDWAPAGTVSTSGNAGAHFQSTVVTGDLRAHVFYTDGATAEAWYRRSDDGGETWQAPAELSDPAAFGTVALAMTADGTTLDVLLGEFDAEENFVLWYRRSLNDGTDWEPAVRLTPFVGDAGKADVARSGDRVTVVWTDGENGKVFVRVSNDGGANFDSKLQVGGTTNQPYPGLDSYDAFPAVVDAAGSINVAWKSNNHVIRTKRSINGEDWSRSMTQSTVADNLYITLSASNAKVMLGYTSAVEGRWRATWRRSTDEGRDWKRARTIAGKNSFNPIFEMRGGLLRVAYSKCNFLNCTSEQALYKESTDFGHNWSGGSQVSRRTHAPFAFVSGLGALVDGHSVVVYTHIDEFGDSHLWSRRSVSEG